MSWDLPHQEDTLVQTVEMYDRFLGRICIQKSRAHRMGRFGIRPKCQHTESESDEEGNQKQLLIHLLFCASVEHGWECVGLLGWCYGVVVLELSL